MSKTNEELQGIMHTTHNNELTDPEVLVQVNEWVLTSIASLIAHDDVDLHATLRHDITSLTSVIARSLGAVRLDISQAIALMEVLYPMKHAIFFAEHGAMEMIGSDLATFASCYSPEIKPIMQPVVLVIIIVSGIHVHKTVVNTKRGTGAFIKGEDGLPDWVYETGTRLGVPIEGSVQEIIKNWKDGPKHIFSFSLDSKDGELFKSLEDVPMFRTHLSLMTLYYLIYPMPYPSPLS